MTEEKAMAIAEASDLVLNGYAVTRDGENFRVVNLKTGRPLMSWDQGLSARRTWTRLNPRSRFGLYRKTAST